MLSCGFNFYKCFDLYKLNFDSFCQSISKIPIKLNCVDLNKPISMNNLLMN